MKVIQDTKSKPKQSYCPTPPERSGTPEMRRTPRHKPLRPAQRSVLLPDGTNPYLLKRPVSKLCAGTQLTKQRYSFALPLLCTFCWIFSAVYTIFLLTRLLKPDKSVLYWL